MEGKGLEIERTRISVGLEFLSTREEGRKRTPVARPDFLFIFIYFFLNLGLRHFWARALQTMNDFQNCRSWATILTASWVVEAVPSINIHFNAIKGRRSLRTKKRNWRSSPCTDGGCYRILLRRFTVTTTEELNSMSWIKSSINNLVKDGRCSFKYLFIPSFPDKSHEWSCITKIWVIIIALGWMKATQLTNFPKIVQKMN